MGVRDITQKEFFANEERFADLVNAICFRGREIVRPEELTTEPESVRKADEMAILERTCDVVRKQAKNGVIYAIYALENQDKVDYRMLVRVMVEESLAYDKQSKSIAKINKIRHEGMTGDEYVAGFRKGDKLTPVYTIVVYWGDKEWDEAKSLRELVDIPEENEALRQEMLQMLPDYRIKVFDLNKEKDFSVFGETLRTVFEFYANHNNAVAMREYMDTHQDEMEALDRESKFFLATMLGQKKLRKELLKKTEKGEDEDMCKAIDDMIKEGELRGIEIGMEKGMEKGMRKGIKRGLREGRAEAKEAIAELNDENIRLKKEIERLRLQLSVQN